LASAATERASPNLTITPRAAAAARLDLARIDPGVFASLGTPGYPPLAAAAAGPRYIHC